MRKKDISYKKFPEWVEIAGQAWKVDISDEVNRYLITDNYFGRSIFSTLTIQLRTKDRPDSAVWETLFHEIIHIILSNSGQLKTVLKERDDEEAITEALSCGLYQVINNNVEFRRLLF